MQIQKTIKNMFERLWDLIKNITIAAPKLLLRTVWKVVMGCSKAVSWCVRMAGLLIWRSLWWGVGACLRAAGMKKAVDEVGEELDNRESPSSDGSFTEEEEEEEVERPRLLTARRGIGSTVVSVETGAEWGYVAGLSEDGTCWKLSTGRFVKKRTMDIAWKWKPMKRAEERVPAKRESPKKQRQRTSRKFVCHSAEEAVALLAKHQMGGGGRVEITIE